MCVCVTSLLYISSECFPRHSSQMHESSKPPKSMEYIYKLEVDTRNTDLQYNTVCISFFATLSNLKTLNLSIYVYACIHIYIYIYMYVCIEVTRPTPYIDDIYIYIYIYNLYAAYMFLVFFMQKYLVFLT